MLKTNDFTMKKILYLNTQYYNLYYQFLTFDKESLVCGRSDSLIVAFLFYHNALLKNDQKTIKEMRKKIVSNLSEYGIEPQELTYANKISTCENNMRLFFSFFYNSMGSFNKFRKTIGESNRKHIAIEMLQHRLQYYNFFEIDITTTKYKEQACGTTHIPLQTLNEFHNAMSHLCSVFISTGASENNIKRAENHLQRAILDLYKVIIKDFFIIVSQDIIKEQNDTIQKIKNDIIEIRNLEYKTIGTDRITRKPSENNKSEENIFQKYEKVCEKIIDFFN